MKRILVSACLLGIGCRYDCRDNRSAAVLSLLEREDLLLIPVCPEQLGGLPTPRVPSERAGERVLDRHGKDVTTQFEKGAHEALRLAKLYGCSHAILKERSPSCGYGRVYDGTFSGKLVEGSGVTAELLERNGIQIIGESKNPMETL